MVYFWKHFRMWQKQGISSLIKLEYYYYHYHYSLAHRKTAAKLQPPPPLPEAEFNPLALELDIYSLAHHLCKM